MKRGESAKHASRQNPGSLRPYSTLSGSQSIPVGVVGLGLMGTSIAACLLAAGHPVVGWSVSPEQRRKARRRIPNYSRD